MHCFSTIIKDRTSPAVPRITVPAPPRASPSTSSMLATVEPQATPGVIPISCHSNSPLLNVVSLSKQLFVSRYSYSTTSDDILAYMRCKVKALPYVKLAQDDCPDRVIVFFGVTSRRVRRCDLIFILGVNQIKSNLADLE